MSIRKKSGEENFALFLYIFVNLRSNSVIKGKETIFIHFKKQQNYEKVICNNDRLHDGSSFKFCPVHHQLLQPVWK